MPFFFFFFNDTATTEIYTLSLHDALPISRHHRLDQAGLQREPAWAVAQGARCPERGRENGEPLSRWRGLLPARRLGGAVEGGDRKSTRLNSSHSQISYAVFCLKKKKTKSI